eukprot:g384.t1
MFRLFTAGRGALAVHCRAFSSSSSGAESLHHAVWSGDPTIVLQHLDGRLDELEERDNHGCTPLVLAVVHRHLPVLQLLLEAGANPNAPAFFMKERQPLHFAAEVTDEASAPMLRLLLEHGALPAETDADGETALSFALKVGNKVAVEVLAPAAAPLDGADGALHCASAMGDTALVELLLQCGAPVDATDAADATPLHVACLLGHESVCDLLLGAGAQPCATNSQNAQPLHEAAAHGHADAAQAVLLAGADADAVTANGHMPAQLAALADSVEVLEILAQHDANLDGALHFAAAAGSIDVVAHLLRTAQMDPLSLFENEPVSHFAMLALNKACEDGDKDEERRARLCLDLLRAAGAEAEGESR